MAGIIASGAPTKACLSCCYPSPSTLPVEYPPPPSPSTLPVEYGMNAYTYLSPPDMFSAAHSQKPGPFALPSNSSTNTPPRVRTVV